MQQLLPDRQGKSNTGKIRLFSVISHLVSWVRSSVVEHVTDNDGVAGSIPAAPTKISYQVHKVKSYQAKFSNFINLITLKLYNSIYALHFLSPIICSRYSLYEIFGADNRRFLRKNRISGKIFGRRDWCRNLYLVENIRPRALHLKRFMAI